MRRVLLGAVLLAAPISNGRADPDPDFDRSGNALVVANAFDGESYQVRLARYARNGGLMNSHVHSDGFQENARVLVAGDDGNAIVGGARYWQGRSYLWALKYHPARGWTWEWADEEPDCVAERVAGQEGGLFLQLRAQEVEPIIPPSGSAP